MAGQICFEDVEIGAELPSITKQQSALQFVKWCGAVHDFASHHFDHVFATKERNLPAVVAPGCQTTGYLGQVLTDWAGPRAVVRKVYGEYRGMSFPGHTLVCGGRVVAKRSGPEGNLVECELWAENQEGKRVTIGSGIVSLPSRADQT